MLLPSTRKEEKYFVYLQKSSPNWKPLFFSVLLWVGRFLVSLAGGEAQLPVWRITRGFNRDKLSALFCAYDKLGLLMWLEIGCFELQSIWIISRKRWGHQRQKGTHGSLAYLRMWQLGLRNEAQVGMVSRTGRENESFPGLVLIIIHFHLRTVYIYHKCVSYPKYLLLKFADILKSWENFIVDANVPTT